MINNAAKIFTWQIFRTGLQALWAILLARVLGPSSYGLFSGLTGLASSLGSLSGFGFSLLMLQNASRNQEKLREYLSNAITVTIASGIALTFIYLAIAEKIINQHSDLFIIFAIAISELFCLPIIILSSYAFQARDKMGWAGAMYALGPSGNIVALVLFMLMSTDQTLESYLKWHILAAITSSGLAVFIVFLILNPGIIKPAINPSDAREALGFTALRVADTTIGSIDKTLVLRIAGGEIAGHYTAAYRLASLIALPAISLGISMAPRLFRSSATDDIQKLNIKRLFNLGLILALISVPATWISSFFIPYLLGTNFINSSEITREMMFLPGLMGLSSIGLTILMTIGEKKSQIHIQLASLLLLGFLMNALIPAQGELGIGISIQCTYAIIALFSWIFIKRKLITNSQK